MFNMTERDPLKGWSDIQPVVHPQNRILTLSVAAWKLASKMVDDGRDWNDIARMQETASLLEEMAHDECICTPRYTCKLCNIVARLIYSEEYIKETK